MEFAPSPRTLNDILPADAQGIFNRQLLINDIQLDSRLVSPGSLFIALQGVALNGEHYIASAVENGAVAILVDESSTADQSNVEVPVITLKHARDRVAEIVAKFFGQPSEKVCVYGVTGTNGKSTIASMIAQLETLSGKMGDAGENNTEVKKGAVIGTLGYGVVGAALVDTGLTTPDVVSCHRLLADLREQGASAIAMEVSSHAIDQGRVEGVAYRVAIISNVTHDHLDYHGTFENYAAVKQQFITGSNANVVVINLDDETTRAMIPNALAAGKKVYTYSVEDSSADVFAEIKEYKNDAIFVGLTSPWGSSEVEIPMVGKFNISNVLAAFTAFTSVNENFAANVLAIQQLAPVEGRLQKVTPSGDQNLLPRVFIDYAHTPDALASVLKAMSEHLHDHLWVVFGCGGDRDIAKRPLMAAEAVAYADRVIVTSDNPRTEDPAKIIEDILKGVNENKPVEAIEKREAAIHLAIGNAGVNDTVLIAGKGHEDYQIIGDKKYPFSDYLVAQEALELRAKSVRAAR